MNNEFKTRLKVNNYIEATGSLMYYDVRSVVTDVKSRINISREESMYLYALENISAIEQLSNFNDLGSAYWQWVKLITMGETAFEGGTYSESWHGARIERAYNRLFLLSNPPNDPRYLAAAQNMRRSGGIRPRI